MNMGDCGRRGGLAGVVGRWKRIRGGSDQYALCIYVQLSNDKFNNIKKLPFIRDLKY